MLPKKRRLKFRLNWLTKSIGFITLIQYFCFLLAGQSIRKSSIRTSMSSIKFIGSRLFRIRISRNGFQHKGTNLFIELNKLDFRNWMQHFYFFSFCFFFFCLSVLAGFRKTIKSSSWPFANRSDVSILCEILYARSGTVRGGVYTVRY